MKKKTLRASPGGDRATTSAAASSVNSSRPGPATPSPSAEGAGPIIKMRPWQIDPFWREDLGLMVLSWRRRAGKSHCMASKALRRMMQIRGNTSVFMSASIPLGTEFIRKEAEVWKTVLDAFRAAAAENHMQLTSSADGLDIDAIADVFEHQKLETKLWHDRTTYSRSIVLAPNPQTAVGYGADIYLDEYGRVPSFQDILEAILPFLDENPALRAMLASTPPPDDSHYSWELTVPPVEDFPVDPKGNWYVSEAGFTVHRADACDCYAGGLPMYDPHTREPLTPDEHRARAFDKSAWDRNYGLRFLRGGTAAVSLLALRNAMDWGRREHCAAIDVSEEITP